MKVKKGIKNRKCRFKRSCDSKINRLIMIISEKLNFFLGGKSQVGLRNKFNIVFIRNIRKEMFKMKGRRSVRRLCRGTIWVFRVG